MLVRLVILLKFLKDEWGNIGRNQRKVRLDALLPLGVVGSDLGSGGFWLPELKPLARRGEVA